MRRRGTIERRRAGFTLIELLTVVAIIGLIVSLVLVASADGVRRAEERATQSLITKLETAVNDRLDALYNTQPPMNQTHRLLAAINSPQTYGNSTSYLPINTTRQDPRAQVIAQFDYIRAELPDVFFVNAYSSDGGSQAAAAYPLNFAAAPYPAGQNTLASPNLNLTTGLANDGGSWALPLGNNYQGLPGFSNNGVLNLSITQNPDGTQAVGTTGMFGASFSAAASIYKLLYTAAASDLLAQSSNCSVNFEPGLDGVDNNNDGLVDELVSPTAGSPEVVVTGSPSQSFPSYVAARLAKHTHKTARSEMLYAILVNGLSPLGSVFNPEDFTAREVQDTDGDGLPEFVDAWGEPLQFFRWPIYYGGLPLYATDPNPTALGTSDSQLGFRQYNSAASTREEDPLDQNQSLVSPGWWSVLANPSLTLPSQLPYSFTPPNSGASGFTNPCSPGAIGFMNYFHSLVDPNPSSGAGYVWDRGGKFTRREYFSKVLILSAGPDHEPGVAQFAKDYSQLVDSYQITLAEPYQYPFPNLGSNQGQARTMEQNALALIYIENQAAVSDPTQRNGLFFEIPDNPNAKTSNQKYTTATPYLNGSANSDDITNHNISGISTGVR
jgi:prepilin-type N-terminal cleavage/methylation domain-containing protein